MTIWNNIFDHSEMQTEMENMRTGKIKNEVCAGKKNFSDTNECFLRGNHDGDLDKMLNGENMLALLINSYTLSYDVTVLRSIHGEKNCSEVEITWKFSDHTEPRSGKSLSVGDYLPPIDYPEACLRWLQDNVTNASFNITSSKKEIRPICCCPPEGDEPKSPPTPPPKPHPAYQPPPHGYQPIWYWSDLNW